MVLDRFNLEGKTAIVTGSATGLGKGLAVGLAEAGADIAGVYNRRSPEETRTAVEKLGRRFISIQADLTTIKPVASIVEQAVEAFGRLDILVNNAGIIRRAPSVEYTEEDWDAVMNVNLKSVFFLSQAAARQFIKQGSGGKIINIASLLSFQGGILIPPYTASKSGMSGLTKLLANEWAQHNINVNAIAPGFINTEMTKKLGDKVVETYLNHIPLKRMGEPKEIASVALFLASDLSSYITGQVIRVDGGLAI